MNFVKATSQAKCQCWLQMKLCYCQCRPTQCCITTGCFQISPSNKQPIRAISLDLNIAQLENLFDEVIKIKITITGCENFLCEGRMYRTWSNSCLILHRSPIWGHCLIWYLLKYTNITQFLIAYRLFYVYFTLLLKFHFLGFVMWCSFNFIQLKSCHNG